MKKLALVLIATALGATAASAQTTVIRRHDDGMGDRVIVKHRRFDDGGRMIHRRIIRGPERVVIRRGRPDCRMVTVRRTNAMGDTVIRKTRRCD